MNRMFKVRPLHWVKCKLVEAGYDLYISENCIQAISIRDMEYADILVTWNDDSNIVVRHKRALEIIEELAQ